MCCVREAISALPFPNEAIGRLYTDYRSDSYNRERVRYEPEYAVIASQAGSYNQEIRARTVGLTRWLNGKLNLKSNFSMLDYGGADGKFLPNVPGEKYVFDSSDIAPAEGVIRIRDESRLGSYSYIQLAHVLEHVSYPLALTRTATSFLKDSGYLYIEVPLELSEAATARLASGDKTIRLDIHEHYQQILHKIGDRASAIYGTFVSSRRNRGGGARLEQSDDRQGAWKETLSLQ